MKGSGKPQIIIYTGEGKGKTSAAVGSLLRAYGHGQRCAVACFGGTFGEAEVLSHMLGDSLFRCFPQGSVSGWEQVKRWISSQDLQLIVLDDFTLSFGPGMLDAGKVATWLDDHHGKKGFPHVVITGRGCPEELLDIADIVTEMRLVRHPLTEKKREALPGIEF